jgi:hypothetical protein
MTVATLVVLAPGCAVNSRSVSRPIELVRESSTSVVLHGTPLELHHLSIPRSPAAGDELVLYASGDGGWFGAAVDMFHEVRADPSGDRLGAERRLIGHRQVDQTVLPAPAEFVEVRQPRSPRRWHSSFEDRSLHR